MPFKLCFHSLLQWYLFSKETLGCTHTSLAVISPPAIYKSKHHMFQVFRTGTVSLLSNLLLLRFCFSAINVQNCCFSWSNSFSVHNLTAWASSVSHSNSSKQMFPISIILLPFSRHPPCSHMLVCKRDNFLCMYKQHRESSSVGVWQYAEFYASTVWNLLSFFILCFGLYQENYTQILTQLENAAFAKSPFR